MRAKIVSVFVIIAMLLTTGGCAAMRTSPTATPVPTREEGPTSTPTVPEPTPTETIPEPTPTQTMPEPTPTEEGEAMLQLARSDVERTTSPEVTEEEMEQRVDGNNAFALDFYRAVRDTEGNLFYSPYSISSALAMAYAGARGETEGQMAETLRYNLSQERLHPAFNALSLALTEGEEEEAEKEKEGDAFTLQIANAVWGQEGYPFLQEYLDVLAKNYGAGIHILDFVQASEEARQTINTWVSEQTNGKIKDLIPQGVIDELTRLILTNAIYFRASWEHPFDEEQTQDGPFHLPDGEEISVPMMRQTARFGYTEDEGYQAVELPYVGDRASMVILAPEAGQFGAFEESLQAQDIESIMADMETKEVALTMPKFSFDARFQLAQQLAEMGMPAAFSPEEADFSGIDGSRELFIQEVLHKAFVSVDETGTEAAAATAVVVGITSAPTEPIELTLDQPFIFLIRDMETDTILFMGRVVDPTS
ncbi:MAG: serpin family protein [Chloroflexota bacterium]